jgi:hypothetical protein
MADFLARHWGAVFALCVMAAALFVDHTGDLD